MKRLPSGAAVDIFETLDSTSLEAKRRAAAGEAGPRWFVALRQMAGYGRRHRAWSQQAGDFAGTLLLRPQAANNTLGQISFVAALAVASALDELIDPALISLKWPNDILIKGGKAAGLLLERVDNPKGPLLAIGIGVNIVSAPKNTPYPAARLVDHTPSAPAPQTLAARIDDHFWRYHGEWAANGFAQTRRLWLARARGLGEAIIVRLPNEEITGVFEDLDETGALILRSDAGKRIINAGEVYFQEAGQER